MSENKKTTISLTPNGPYIIKDLTNFTSQKGSVKTQQTMALCRCGQSANKPFCDGAHVKINFTTDNNETHFKNKRNEYVGKEITVYDNRSICAHAGVCTDNLSNVFRMKQKPWIDPNAADVNEIISVIKRCPSGALSYRLSETGNTQQENQPEKNQPEIFIAPNGPYVVSGCPDLSDTNWREGASQQQYTLCRCGASKNKPYCDGSHWSIEFKDNEN